MTDLRYKLRELAATWRSGHYARADREEYAVEVADVALHECVICLQAMGHATAARAVSQIAEDDLK
jgi:hypothetical protein